MTTDGRSKACLPCRSKRRKCDYKRPWCTQCLRALTICTGYRDESRLIYRDETFSTSRKARARYAKLGRSVSHEDSPHSQASVKSPPVDTDSESLFHLPFGVESSALTYFLNSHVSTTLFGYLQNFYVVVRSDDTVQNAVIACALTSFGRCLEQPAVSEAARSYYVKASATVRQNLGVAEKVTEHSTLLAVLLLSTFEAMTFCAQNGPVNWTNHVNGLSTLLSLRGVAQFRDELGQVLFSHASLQVFTLCFQMTISVPKRLQSLQTYAISVLHLKRIGLVFGKLISSAAMLRVNRNNMVATEVVREALQLDNEVVEIMQRDPSRLEVERMHSSTPKGYNNAHCQKTNLIPPQSGTNLRRHNVLRVLRICFQEWIYDAVQPDSYGPITDLPSQHDFLYECLLQQKVNALLQFEAVAHEILNNVPCFTSPRSKSPYLPRRYLLCPLVNIAISPLCSPATRKSALELLLTIREGYDEILAQQAVSMIECGKGTDIANWLYIPQFS